MRTAWAGKPLLTSEQEAQIRFIRVNLPYSKVFRYYHLEWKKDSDHQFSCPFHATKRTPSGQPYENNPSAHFYADDRRTWCFACVDGGDVVWFVRRMEKLKTTAEAIDYIAKTFGVGWSQLDLGKRIQEVHQPQTDQKREMVAQQQADKVNDVLHMVKQELPAYAHLIDRISVLLFKEKDKINSSTLPYQDYVRLQREWAERAVHTLRQAIAQWSKDKPKCE